MKKRFIYIYLEIRKKIVRPLHATPAFFMFFSDFKKLKRQKTIKVRKRSKIRQLSWMVDYESGTLDLARHQIPSRHLGLRMPWIYKFTNNSTNYFLKYRTYCNQVLHTLNIKREVFFRCLELFKWCRTFTWKNHTTLIQAIPNTFQLIFKN